MQEHWDWIVVGSGFGGSVSALRLAEKGYSVLVLEKGGRWALEDFPKTNWNLPKWMWLPQMGWRGIFKMTFLRHVTILSGVGVGGGSLVYANTLPTPEDGFFKAKEWGHLADWKTELHPHYATARRMLGRLKCTRFRETSSGSFAAPRRTGRLPMKSPRRIAHGCSRDRLGPPNPFAGGGRACRCPR